MVRQSFICNLGCVSVTATAVDLGSSRSADWLGAIFGIAMRAEVGRDGSERDGHCVEEAD